MPRYKGTANSKYAKAMREIRRSNASGIHLDKRAKRARTRQARLDKAIQEHTEK